MSKKPETLFRERFVEWLKKLPNTVVFSIQQVAIIGTADLICCINGKFVAIELKASEDCEASAIQKYNLQRIVNQGKGISLILAPQGLEKAQVFLSAIANGSSPYAPEGTVFN